MGRFDTAAELRDYERAAADVLALLDRAQSDLSRVAPDVSGWSAIHHAAHVTLANELVLKNLRSLVKGEGLLVVREAQQIPAALAVLEQSRFERGRAKSPRMVVPPADVDLDVVREWAAAFTRDLAHFVREWKGDPKERAFVPHQILGPLDLCEWTRFGVAHTRHHVAIARDVLAAQR